MAANVASVDFYTDDSASPMTVTKPAAFGSGDILVMFIVDDGGVLSDLTAATGFTLITGATVDITGQRAKAFYHVYDGTEAGTFDFGYNAGAAAAGALVRVTGADTGAPTFVAATGNSASNGSSMDSPTVTPTGSDDLLLCALTNSGGAAAFSETDPSGMTDQGQIQVSDLFQAIAVASQQLASASATGAKTWTSISPTARQAGSFSIAIKSASAAAAPAAGPQPVLPAHLVLLLASWAAQRFGPAADIRAQTGSAAIGVAGAGTAVRVAGAAGAAAIGLAGSGAPRKVAAAAGTGTVGLAGSGVQRKVQADAGAAAVGFVGAGTQRKVQPDGGRSALGAVGGGAQRKVAPDGGRSAVGLAGSGAGLRKAADGGLAAVGVTGAGSAARTPTAAQTGRATVAFVGAGAPSRRAVGSGRAAVGFVGQGSPLAASGPELDLAVLAPRSAWATGSPRSAWATGSSAEGGFDMDEPEGAWAAGAPRGGFEFGDPQI